MINGRKWIQSLEPRELLGRPVVYDAFQSIIGANNSRRMFIEEFVAPLAGKRVLEVGCGPGGNCRWVPPTVDYVGTDINAEYVSHARDTYGDKAEFHICPVGELASLNIGRFAAVIAVNLLHHLADSQVADLCDEVKALLDEGGVIITADPCVTPQQSRLERKITLLDRGKHVRSPENYADLMRQNFDHFAIRVGSGHARFPNTGTTMVAWNGPQDRSTVACAKVDAGQIRPATRV
jgi:cyclopropane fatty-acyl-phospholipid synthase-like methyltransferase